jgi:glycosyltransferase involved in cell wall biosynthesis
MSVHLVLFFTRGVSLRTWSMVGNLDREIALYRRLIDLGHEVSFVTYGDSEDMALAGQLGGIRILCNETALPLEQYESLIPTLHGEVLRTAHVIKTNQTYGAELALSISQLLGTSFVARCGYMWSFNAAREHGENSFQATEARRVEEKAFLAADRVVVTTDAMRADVETRMPETIGRVRVIPNYVDTDTFRSYGTLQGERSLIFVGRIAPEKNLAALLQAIRPLAVRLTLIGEGKLRPQLQREFTDLDGRVAWEGNIPNALLAGHINRAGIFVLPSLYEGHPKALLEAMACGVPVIASDSPGVRDVVRHGETGYLTRTDPESIRSAIEDVLARPDLCERLARGARDYVVAHYSLDRILGMESDLLNELGTRL